MPEFKDLTGMKFGRWTVIEVRGKRGQQFMWACRCDCGTERVVIGDSLKKGISKSCGCYSRERVRTHGMDATPTYNAWAHMKTRCLNPEHKQYADYGGRGISVCERWHKFENFYADMGLKPAGMSLDRIDNDGNYEPGNCRWATITQQIRNRRVSPVYDYEGNGNFHSLAEIAEKYGIPWRRLYGRMRAGWSLEDAISVKKANRWTRMK